MSDSESKKLSELRVVDLRAELEKRGLDKNGVKQVLFDRLKEAIEKAGNNPDTYVFELGEKKRRTSVQNTEEEKSASNAEEKMETEEDNDQINEAEEDEHNETVEGEENDDNEGEEEKAEEEESKTEKGDKKIEENDSHESPIRLTLEDDEEALHDDEAETDKEKSKDSNTKDEKKESHEHTKTDEDGKDKDNETDENRKKSGEKLQKKVGAKSNPNVVWVSNVAQNTRASELKAALSACGKVTGAKVVVNARYPGSNCFGYVTMGSVEDVDNVIAKLNNTELNGQIIKIEKFDQVRADQMRQMKETKAAQSKSPKKDEKSHDGEKKERKEDEDKSEKNDEEEGTEKLEEKAEEKEGGKESSEDKNQDRTRSKERKTSLERKLSKDRSKLSDDEKSRSVTSKERGRSRERRQYRSRSRSRGRRPVLTFDKIIEERERQRLRERERALREETRRRHEESIRQRKIESRQRNEAARLEREREKLRIEKEKIEREKAELVRMERERQRLEMEKIALEKLELERTLIRLEEDRRAAKRVAPPAGYRERDEAFDGRKRPALADRHFDAPPPPRFEPPNVKARELTPKKFSAPKEAYGGKSYDSKHLPPSYRDKHPRDYDGPSMSSRPGSGPSSRDPPRDIIPPKPRDSRYIDRERERDRDRSPHFRGSMRDDRRPPGSDLKPGLPLSRSDHVSRNDHLPPRNDHRYDASNEPAPPRFERNQSSWTGGSSKPFSGSGGPSKPWMRERDNDWKGSQSAPNERWTSGSQSNSSMGRPFSNSSSSMAPVCPPPPGINSYNDSGRFDYSKSMGSMRKY